MTADWIWTGADLAPANRFTWFRKVVDLPASPVNSSLRFAADSTAQLWVNGTLVRRKVSRYDEPNVRADVVPLARQLRPGPNVIVVLHHNWGDITTFQRTGNLRAGLYLDGEWVSTDASWRWMTAREFEAHTEQFLGIQSDTPRIRYPVRWDATAGEDPAGIHFVDYDDSHWSGAVAVDDPPWPRTPFDVETPGQRESLQRSLSVLAAGRVRSTFEPDAKAASAAAALAKAEPYEIVGTVGEKHYLTVDFQRPVHGYPFIELDTDANVKILIGYGELAVSPYNGNSLVTTDGWIDPDGVVAQGYSDTLHPATDRRRYEFPDERTARWLTVQVAFLTTGTVTIHDLGIVKSQYPVEFRGTFACGNEQLEQIVKLALVHAEVTMSDSYVDTPGREDGQWIEDARPRATLAARWFGDVRLRRLMIRTLAEGQRPDGNLHPFFPSNFPYGPAQWDWSLQWVGMIVDDYRWTADVAFVAEYFPAIERLLDAVTALVGSDGIWRSPLVFGDIRNSAPIAEGGSSGIVTPWVIDRLKDGAELGRLLGSPRAELWDALAELMTAGFRNSHLSMHNDSGVALVADSVDMSGTPSGFSQAGQAIPLYDGLLTAHEAADVIDVAFPAPDASPPEWIARWNSPTWSYRILKALSEHGHHSRALAHLLERYRTYLPGHPDNVVDLALQGPYGGPLPEYWLSRRDLALAAGELNDRQPRDPSGSHGWGAMPLLWLHEYLLGVTVTTPGGAGLAIRPVSAGLPYVTGTTITPKGSVYIHLEPSAPTLVVEIPVGATARVELPLEFEGLRVLVNGMPTDRGELVAMSGGRWEITCIGGEW